MAKQAPISKQVRDDMEMYFSQTDPETGKPYTLEAVATKLNLPVSTVGKYRQKWEERAAAEADAASTTTRPDPVAVLERELRGIPGVQEARVDWAIKRVRDNPDLYLTNTQELWRLLFDGVRLQPYHAEMVMKPVVVAIAASNGQSAPPFFGGPLGGPGGGAAPPWIVGGGSAQQPPWYGTPPWYGATGPGTQQPPPPWYAAPPWYVPPPPAPQPAGLSRDDVREIVEQVVQRSAPPPSAEFEETQEPVLDGQGRPLIGPDGPLLRFTRRPVGSAGARQPDVLEMLRTARDFFVPKTDPALDTLRQSVAALEQRLAGGAGHDDKTQTMLMDIKEKLAAEAARREAAEKYAKEREVLEEKLRAAEVASARNSGNLPPDAQILKGAIDTGDKHLGQVLANAEKRQDRMERMVGSFLMPMQGGTPLPVGEDEIKALEARQRALDEQAAREEATRTAAAQEPTPATGTAPAPPPPAAAPEGAAVGASTGPVGVETAKPPEPPAPAGGS